MALALVAASFVSVAAIAFVVYGGLRVQAETLSVTRHIARALPAMVVSMFARSMTLMYFVGTGGLLRRGF